MLSPAATQDRLKALLEPHFANVTILTQRPANIEALLKEALGKLGYVILISVPGGRNDGSTAQQLKLSQTYRITMVQSALYRGSRVLLDDLMVVMGAVHGASLVANGKGPLMFFVNGHELDTSEAGLNIQHVEAEIKVLVDKA